VHPMLRGAEIQIDKVKVIEVVEPKPAESLR